LMAPGLIHRRDKDHLNDWNATLSSLPLWYN
jgi:hypothetical protein